MSPTSVSTSEVSDFNGTTTQRSYGAANQSSPASSSSEYRGLFSPALLSVVTATCLLLFAFGVLGNSLTILVFSRTHDMRTTTYLYLSSMAASDLLIFACMPFELYRVWQHRPWLLGDLVCKCVYFVSESCTYATILHITALSVERYLAICFPLWAKVAITRRRVRALILGLWALALGSAGPIISIMGVEAFDGEPTCKETEEARASGMLQIFTWMSTAYFFLGGQVAVVVAFVVCWLPFHAGRHIFASPQADGKPFAYDLSQYLSLVSMVLFYVSSAINPLLYNFMSRKYRTAARRLLGARLPPALYPGGRGARAFSSGAGGPGASGSSAASSYRRRARSVSSSVQEDSTQAFVLDPGGTAM